MNKRASLFSEVSDSSLSREKRKRAKSSSPADANVREMKELVAELRPDDGIDPRYAAKKRRHEEINEARPGSTHGVHKQEQLLSQVHSAIETALQCATTPILNELAVMEVARQGGALVVVVAPRNSEARVDVPAATDALQKASSMFKREVASTITRKEAPSLKFVVLPVAAKRMEG
jgi:ribosome-binding factor A